MPGLLNESLLARASLWLAGVAVLVGVLCTLLATNHLKIQTDLFALLPEPQRDPIQSAAMHRIASLGERRLAIFIAAPERDQRQRAAQAAADSLAGQPVFTDVVSKTEDLLTKDQRQALADLHFRHRFQLLAPEDRATLQNLADAGNDDAAFQPFIQRAQARLYGIGIGGGGRFIDDPFGLATSYRNAMTASATLPGIRIAPDGSMLAKNTAGQSYAAVFARTREDPFTMSAQAPQSDGLQAALNAARAASPEADILVSGVLLHAAAATQTARNEITLIGGGSLVGILLLMAWAFASIRPFLLSLLAIAGGCLLALVATASLFGSVHILTLVFGASLVGVAIDYCFHFFAQRWHTAAPRAALAVIFPAITLGLITSVLAYGGMTIAPFPALRQMAVFAAFGLIGAWLGVVLLLPACAGPPPRAGAVVSLAKRWLSHGPARLATGRGNLTLWCMGIAFIIGTGVALTWLEPNDDIRLLYNPSPDLLQDERQVAELMGTQSAGRAIAVSGDTVEQVLANEAALVQALTAVKPPVAEFTAITRSYPPVAQQRQDYHLLETTLYQADGPLDRLLSGLGFSADAIQAHRADFAQASTQTLRFEDWQASPAGTSLDQLWLGKTGDQSASLILLHQIHDEQALAKILTTQNNAIAIDRVSDISTLLGRYRGLASGLLGAAYLLAGLILCAAFGLRGAFIVLLAPLLASAITALLFAVTGWPFSLFNLMAMVLLLGMGADYGIFLRMGDKNREIAMAAVGLSAVTTLLAFGLLALSQTPALQSFGLTLALGLTLTFLIASLISNTHHEGATNNR